MIDLRDLRANPQKYRQGAADKQSHADIDALLTADEELRDVQTQVQELAAEKNRIGKQIGQLAGQLKRAPADEQAALRDQMQQLQQRPTELKTQEAELNERQRQLTEHRDALWLETPQPADPDVPVGTCADDNVQLRTWAPSGYDLSKTFAQNRGFTPKTHVELCENLGLVDFQRGQKIGGARSYVLTGDGMRLHQAVLRYAFDTMIDRHGFTALSAADLVRHDMMVGTGFFPHGREQVYDVANPTSEVGLALSGTGEVALMGYRQGEVLNADELPLKYTTVSTCFRREAGAAGKDTAGLYRVHQFDKVEQVVICEAHEAVSREWHQTMIGLVEQLLQSLELPYRLLQCCTGDLGPKNADMIDLECWMPGRGERNADQHPQGDWGETHSASRLYDFQCRRLNIRYRDPDTGQPRVAHSLNNTVTASPRLLIPILEMHQQPDGRVAIPQPLRPYLSGKSHLG